MCIRDSIETMAQDDLTDRNRILTRAINASLPTDSRISEEACPRTRIVGLERVTEESAALFERVIGERACGRSGVFFWGGLATLLFVGLLTGPLVAVYREFLTAWLGVFHGQQGVHWQAFPVPSAGMILSLIHISEPTRPY